MLNMESRDSLSDLERKREQLEVNVNKLRASLKHWQDWEIEYEGMKEELLALGRHHSQKDLERLQYDDNDGLTGVSQANLLNEKERRLLLRNESGKLRNANSVVGLLSRRIEYVQHNLKSIASLLSAAEEELTATMVLIEPEVRSDEGLPLTEIHEELDEDGNVISSSTSNPGEIAGPAFDSLRKAGFNLPGDRPSQDFTASGDDETAIDDRSTSSVDTRSSHKRSESDIMSTSDSTSRSNRHRRPKKRKQVSFAEGTKAEHDPSEHPSQLPKEEQIEMLKSACNQFRQQMGKSVAATKIPLPFELGVNMPDYATSEIDCAFQILKLRQNREAKRLLKASDLDSKGSAALLCKMASKGDYDVDSPTMIQAIAEVKDMNLTPSSSRESSPRAHRSPPRVRFATPDRPLDQADTAKGPASSTVANASTMTAVAAQETNNSQAVELTNGHAPIERAYDVKDLTDARNGGIPGDWVTDDESSATVPNDESPDDNELRRQMLKYSMQEVGAVVAEMDLENDPEEDDRNGDDDESMDLDDIGSDDDEEDEHGRTVSQVVSGKYLADMRDLEERLKARMMVNSGPGPINDTGNDDDKASISTNDTSKKPKKGSATKGVRFADHLDIQEVPFPGPATNGTSHHLTSAPVIEHEPSSTTNGSGAPPPSQSKKQSRFKAARQAGANPATTPHSNGETPSQQQRTSLASAPVIERPMKENNAASPDEMENAFTAQQVRNEYQRMLNREIAEQGGFLNRNGHDEEDQDGDGNESVVSVVGPGVNEEGVGVGKMSRFKAARLGLR